MRNIGAGTLEEPLVTSIALNFSIKKIADGTKAESSVGGNDLQRGHFAEKTLARIQGEWVLLTTNLFVSMTDLVLLEVIHNGGVILVPLHGVLDDGIMARGDHNHLLRPSDDLFVLQARKSLRTNLDASHVGVVVQDVDVVQGLDTNH